MFSAKHAMDFGIRIIIENKVLIFVLWIKSNFVNLLLRYLFNPTDFRAINVEICDTLYVLMCLNVA